MTRDDVIGFLELEYERLEQRGVDRSQIYANIIALKREEGLHDYLLPLYVDAKRYIRFFFEDLRDKDYGYDEFSLPKFSQIIDQFNDEQALRLYQYLHYLCSSNNIATSDIESKTEALQLNLWKKNGQYLRRLLYMVANKGSWIVAVALIYLLAVILCFLPAPVDWMVCLNVNFFDWPDYSWWDRVSSYISTVLFYIMHGETESPIVTPLNLRGVLLILLFEFIFWGLIVNFLYQQILKYLQGLGLSENR